MVSGLELWPVRKKVNELQTERSPKWEEELGAGEGDGGVREDPECGTTIFEELEASKVLRSRSTLWSRFKRGGGFLMRLRTFLGLWEGVVSSGITSSGWRPEGGGWMSVARLRQMEEVYRARLGRAREQGGGDEGGVGRGVLGRREVSGEQWQGGELLG